MSRSSGLAFVVLSLALSACAPGRMADLKDSGRLGLGLGLGLSVDAQAGGVTHPSLGLFASAAMFGLESRHVEGVWYEASVSDPYATFWLHREGKSWGYSAAASGWRGVWESVDWIDALNEVSEDLDQEGLPESGTQVGGEILRSHIEVDQWLPVAVAQDLPNPWSFNSATELQLGVHLLFVNARAGINPLEFADFVGGLFGYDLAGDDPPAP